MVLSSERDKPSDAIDITDQVEKMWPEAPTAQGCATIGTFLESKKLDFTKDLTEENKEINRREEST